MYLKEEFMTYSQIRQILYENHIEVETFHDELGSIIRTKNGISYYFDKNGNLIYRIYL